MHIAREGARAVVADLSLVSRFYRFTSPYVRHTALQAYILPLKTFKINFPYTLFIYYINI